MIKNSKQFAITKAKLAELKSAKESFELQETNKTGAKYRLGIDSFNSLIEDLEDEIKEYEGLVNGNLHCLQAKSLIDIPKVLIAARIAQKLSQKELGELLGLKEQQIQRYEATDYETASWPRIFEIAFALKLKFDFKEEMFVTQESNYNFEYPNEITEDLVETARKKVRSNRSLISF